MRKVLLVLAAVATGLLFLGCSNPLTSAKGSTTTSLSTTASSLASTTATPEPATVLTSESVPNVPSSAAATTSSSLASTTTSALVSTTATTAASSPEARLHAPKPGSAERKAILDALRVPVEKQLSQPVIFVVGRLQVQDGFAFVQGRPVQPNGAAIDYSRTPYAQAQQAGAFSGEVFGLLHWSDGTWRVLTHNLGATDVTWLDWPQEYGAPQAIFPPTGG
jgi:hypothetical protein